MYLNVNIVDVAERNYAGRKGTICTNVLTNRKNYVKKENGELDISFFEITTLDSLTEKDIDNFIKEEQVKTDTVAGKLVTRVDIICINGFVFSESSACLDNNNYSEEIGAKCCREKIKDKLWSYLAFVMACGLNGFDKKEIVE